MIEKIKLLSISFKSNPNSVISQSEVVQRAERDLEADTLARQATSKETQLDSNNWLKDNLEFLGKALQTSFEGHPKGTCTKFDNEANTWCGQKVLVFKIFIFLFQNHIRNFLRTFCQNID